MLRYFLPALCLMLLGRAGAAEFRVLPNDVALHGSGASQRLLAVEIDKGLVVADHTLDAEIVSADEKVVRVKGFSLLAVGDGETTVTATIQGQKSSIKVKVTGTKAALAPSFRNQVVPIMTKAGCNSGACHGALAGKGGLKLSLRGYDPETDHFVLTRQAQGRRVDRESPNKSLFLQKPTMALNHGGGQRIEVESVEYRLLSEWVAAGAPAPTDKDVRPVRLEVFPAAAMLKPEDRLQVVVRAFYSDGTSADVTRWARFASSEELVASIDEAGKVKVAGHGEAAITVLFGNQVGVARVISPYPHKIDAKAFKDAARQNYVDELVLKKLEMLRLAPAPLCSDYEFIRRAYLDAMGVLPSPDEVKKFIGETGKDKRAKLIDAILKRQEFIDYWAHKWSDLLLVSTRKLPQPGVWAFHQHIRQNVADNTPWDRFARDILTAQGSTLQNGAGNYFVLHRDVSDLTESTSVTFLGTSITCARCHNHPLEKWTQDQYWMMANLFSRVGLKNGDKPGEVFVQAQTQGDVLHLRRGVAMTPTPLDGTGFDLTSKADRRAHFADWLTAKENPYFAKALVNRVWRNFLGRGLVEAEDDLRATNPPTNDELFDKLAQDFIDHKYDVQYLIRVVMNSATYQRSSITTAQNEADDRFFSHYLVKRLNAEVILDAYSQVTGVPTAFIQVNVGATGGTAPTTNYPLGTRAMQLPDSLLVSPFLEAFGRADRIQTCACERQQDSSVGQALHLNNGKTLNDKLRAKNSLVEKWVTEKISDDDAIERVYLLGLGRPPTDAEKKKLKALLAEAAQDKETMRRDALEDLIWGVLTSKEFVFNR